MTEPRNLTDKQELFLDALFGEALGNPAKAYVIAGYEGATHYWLVKALKEEIIERAKALVAAHGPKAVMALVGMLEQEGATAPGANVKLTAAQTLLDRMGVVKQDKVELKVDGPVGLFVLPPKDNA